MAPRQIDTSIVLTTCSRSGLLRSCIESLFQQTWIADHSVELIVVDDASTDDTPAVLADLQRIAPLPLIILQGESRGVAAARNLGCSRASGTWLASFDDDQLASPQWLSALRTRADLQSGGQPDQQTACVGGALELLLPEGTHPASLGPRVRGTLGEHLLAPTATRYSAASHPATNNVLIRRDLFATLNGFDTTFTEGGEDKDFFDRAARAGHTLWFEPHAHALHVTPRYRLECSNLRWTSLRVGAADARITLRAQHRLGTLLAVTGRLVVTLVRDLPLLLFARLSRDRRKEFNTLCSLWYTEGLLRAFAALTSREPQGSAFLRSINFRIRNGERPSAK